MTDKDAGFLKATGYPSEIGLAIDAFKVWINQYENQERFNSLQGAFKQWLTHGGFYAVGGDYQLTIAMVLNYLSLCIANPVHRRYLSGPELHSEERTLLQVNVPDDETGDFDSWEFLTEENFHKMYAEWRRFRGGRG